MNQKTKAVCLMLFSALSFSAMQIFIAKTADTFHVFEQLFFRNLISTIIAYVSIRKQHLRPWGQPQHRLLLSLRSGFGYLGMLTTFLAAGSGHQGDISTIIKMSPFIITLLSYLFLKESISKYQIIALFVATAGVLCVSNPQFSTELFPLAMAWLACISAGFAYTLVSALKDKEPPEVTIFFFSAVSTLFTVPLMCMHFTLPTLGDFCLLLLIGVFAGMGQIGLTYSYCYAKASEVSIYNYSGIVFSLLLGFLFLGQPLKPSSLLGAALVIAAGFLVYRAPQPEKV